MTPGRRNGRSGSRWAPAVWRAAVLALQPRMPEAFIRRSLGLIVIAVATRYLLEGI